MSSTRPPVRRAPSRAVYRRRRLGVAATAVLLVVATVNLVKGHDDPPADDTVQQVVSTPRTTPRTTPSASAEVPVGPVEGRRPSSPRTTAPSTPEPVLAEPEGACADSDVTVRPEVTSAVAGRRVVMTLALSTTTSEACTWTVSDEHLAYKITDADGDVWTSSDCPAQVPSTTVVVRRDVLTTFRLAWNGRASSRECPDSMEAVDPGTYAVQAAAIGGQPSAVVKFKLVDPAALAPTTPAGPTVPKTTSTSKAKAKAKATKTKKKASTSGR